MHRLLGPIPGAGLFPPDPVCGRWSALRRNFPPLPRLLQPNGRNIACPGMLFRPDPALALPATPRRKKPSNSKRYGRGEQAVAVGAVCAKKAACSCPYHHTAPTGGCCQAHRRARFHARHCLPRTSTVSAASSWWIPGKPGGALPGTMAGPRALDLAACAPAGTVGCWRRWSCPRATAAGWNFSVLEQARMHRLAR